jgi:hypothetical protein
VDAVRRVKTFKVTIDALNGKTFDGTYHDLSRSADSLAAFLPMIFWPGLMGEFMKYLPITVEEKVPGAVARAQAEKRLADISTSCASAGWNWSMPWLRPEPPACVRSCSRQGPPF